ncbi:putative N-acetyltransferase YvbK [compost metagenome]
MDFMAQLGLIACGTRLKRLSDMFYDEAQRIYAAAGVPFEPKWFALFALVSETPEISVTEAASALGLSHVAVSKLARELAREGLFTIVPSEADRRRSNLKLTARGEEMLHQLEPLWTVIEEGCRRVSDQTTSGIMPFIEELEAAIAHQALSQHVLTRLQAPPSGTVEIIDYAPRYRHHFERLNTAWITRYFTLEPADQAVLGDPERHLIQPGGDVLFARLDGRIIGTCGLEKHGAHAFELVKMAVSDAAQGRGAGRLLLEAAIDRARALGADKLVLWTSSRLGPALALYRKHGFQQVEPPEASVYARADVYMELAL